MVGPPILFAETSSGAVRAASAVGTTSAHRRALMAILALRYTARTVPTAVERIGAPIPIMAGALTGKSIVEESTRDEPRKGRECINAEEI